MKSGSSFRSSLAKLKGRFFARLGEESSFGLEPVLQGEAVTEKPPTANGRGERERAVCIRNNTVPRGGPGS